MSQNSIRAIIVYNGGSAGDFLKGVCNQQITQVQGYHVTARGNVEFSQHHFKFIVESLYQGHKVNFDYAKVQPVENTHYYLPSMQGICSKIFFIDYPDDLHEFVIERMCRTRYFGDLSAMFDIATQYLPTVIRQSLDQSDIYTVLKIAYRKNLAQWRANPDLKAICMADLVEVRALENVVKQVCDISTVNQVQLQQAHRQWIEKNPDLLEHLF